MELIVGAIGFFIVLGAVIFWAGYRMRNPNLDEVIELLQSIKRKENQMLQEMIDLAVEIAEMKTVEQGAVALMVTMEAKIEELAGQVANLNPEEIKAKLIEMKDDLHNTETELANAIANVPPINPA
jgi:hypothetical protein